MRNALESVSKVIVYHSAVGLFSTVETVIVVLELLNYVRSADYLCVGLLVGVAYFLVDLTERVVAVVAALKSYEKWYEKNVAKKSDCTEKNS